MVERGGDLFSEWEIGFLRSIREYIEDDDDLTNKQQEVLDRLKAKWLRHCAKLAAAEDQ